MKTNTKQMLFIFRMLIYGVFELALAFLANYYHVSWYLPVLALTFFFFVLELLYQLTSLATSVKKLENRLPSAIINHAPAIYTYMKEIDENRNLLANGANMGHIHINSRAVTKYLAEQLNSTSNFFYAVSPVEMDMDLWTSERRNSYMLAQEKAINRSIRIKRLFVGLALHEIYEEAFLQSKKGIDVRFYKSSNGKNLDMGIFDSSFVYYSNREGSSHMSTQSDVILAKQDLFQKMWTQAIPIPDTPPIDNLQGIDVYNNTDSSFGCPSLLDAWENGVDTGEYMTPSIADSGYKEFLFGLCRKLAESNNNIFSVLSIGAGTGTFEEILRSKLSAKITCIEVLQKGVDILKTKNFEVIKTNGTDLSPLKGKKYKLILMDGVLVHLGDISLKKTLKESLKHLSPEGKIVVSSDAPLDTNARSAPHKRVEDGVLRSHEAIINLAQQVGLELVPNTPKEFPYYRPMHGYTKRAIAILRNDKNSSA